MSDTLMAFNDEMDHEETVVDAERYLVIRVGEALYATPLLGVREVAEPPPVKPVPGTNRDLAGVVNLRGQVVPVLDLERHLGFGTVVTNARAMMVFDTPNGTVAALVRDIHSVLSVRESDMARDTSLSENIPEEHVLGLVNMNDRIVFLVDLNSLLAKIEVRVGRATL